MPDNQTPARARRRSGITRLLVPAVVLAAVVLFVLALVSDGDEVIAALRSLNPALLALALLLATMNYLLRFVRWEFYLRSLQISVPMRASAVVFFSGLAMAITPGKLGELVKAVLLRERAGTPASATVPVVIAERFSDLAAVVLIVAFGIGAFPTLRIVFVVGLVVVAALFAVFVISPRAVDRVGAILSRSLLKGREVGWATESSDTLRSLLVGVPLLGGLVLGIAAWFAECVAAWVVLRGFGQDLPLLQVAFVYAVATLAGALSMLPGGLGATEASMTGLLVGLGAPLTDSTAATLLIRACTLWWGEFVGLAFYATHAASMRGVLAELEALDEDATT